MSLADPARRLAVDRVEAVGAYTLLVLRNDGGDVGRPGQFFMLSAWPEPADAYLPRALSAAWADEREIAFLVDVRGAGTRALVDAASVEVRGPLGTGLRHRRPAGAAGRRRHRRGDPALAGPRAARSRLASCSASAARRMPSARRWSSDDPTVVLDPVLVTEPLARLLPFDGVVYACGPDPMLHAVAALCAEHDVECQVAMEAAMACGYGACYGCAVQIDGVWKRLCVEGPVLEAEQDPGVSADLRTSLCGIELEHPLVNGSGTLDALVAGTLGLAAFVTKTVTLDAARGQPAGADRRDAGRDGQLDRPGEPRARPLLRGAPAAADRAGRAAGGQRRRLVARAVRDRRLAGSAPCPAWPRSSSTSPARTSTRAASRSAPTPARRGRCSSAAGPRPTCRCWPSCRPASPTSARSRLAAAEGGAHGLVLINTVRGMAIDRDTLRPLLGGGGGGLSGPAVKPVALHAVYHSYAATGLPIVGMGGVASAQDCLELMAAGALCRRIGHRAVPRSGAARPDPRRTARAARRPRLLGGRGCHRCFTEPRQ